MPLTNTPQSYGAITKTLHWVTAFGILLMIPLGLIAHALPYDTAADLAFKATLFSIHKTVGVALFFVAVIRILWALTQPRPAPLHPERRAESFLAATIHWLLYGSLVAGPLSGWVHHAATDGFAPIWGPLGQSLPLVPKDPAFAEAAAGLHSVFVWALGIALALHVAGALKHHVIDKDATLRRMLPGSTRAGAAPAKGHGAGAPVAALAIWGAAIGLGGVLGVYGQGTSAAQVAELQEVESDWQVREGTLTLTVRQFGKDIEGRFADWTADITFDDSPGPGPKGAVTVQVAIGSLSLGSVTDQAMGPDYFAAESHPTATFTAEILRRDDGTYGAEGSLALKGAEVPMTLPFTLEIDDRTARMTGTATLDRRNFGIGENMTDPGQLGFEVNIAVDLTAERQDQPGSPG